MKDENFRDSVQFTLALRELEAEKSIERVSRFKEEYREKVRKLRSVWEPYLDEAKRTRHFRVCHAELGLRDFEALISIKDEWKNGFNFGNLQLDACCEDDVNYLQNFEWDRIEQATIVRNDLSKIPMDFFQKLEKISQLSIKGCNIERIPDIFGNFFPKLTSLDLSENLIQSLPHSMKNLHNLNFLSIHSNQLKSHENIDASLQNSHNSIETQLWSNNLVYIPSISVHEIINLRNNKIQCVNLSNSCEKVKQLILQYNFIQKLPDNFGTYFNNLQKLDLHKNKLKSIPQNLHTMKNLAEVDLSQNIISDSTFPDSLLLLHNLVKLNLRGNNQILDAIISGDGSRQTSSFESIHEMELYFIKKHIETRLCLLHRGQRLESLLNFISLLKSMSKGECSLIRYGRLSDLVDCSIAPFSGYSEIDDTFFVLPQDCLQTYLTHNDLIEKHIGETELLDLCVEFKMFPAWGQGTIVGYDSCICGYKISNVNKKIACIPSNKAACSPYCYFIRSEVPGNSAKLRIGVEQLLAELHVEEHVRLLHDVEVYIESEEGKRFFEINTRKVLENAYNVRRRHERFEIGLMKQRKEMFLLHEKVSKRRDKERLEIKRDKMRLTKRKMRLILQLELAHKYKIDDIKHEIDMVHQEITEVLEAASNMAIDTEDYLTQETNKITAKLAHIYTSNTPSRTLNPFSIVRRKIRRRNRFPPTHCILVNEFLQTRYRRHEISHMRKMHEERFKQFKEVLCIRLKEKLHHFFSRWYDFKCERKTTKSRARRDIAEMLYLKKGSSILATTLRERQIEKWVHKFDAVYDENYWEHSKTGEKVRSLSEVRNRADACNPGSREAVREPPSYLFPR